MRYLFLTSVLVAAFAAGPTMAQDAVTIEAGSHEQYGAYLTDSEGRSLYLFEADAQGKGDKNPVSSCYDDCAQAWPPLIVQAKPKAGENVETGLLGTVERKDGQQQAAYNGWPLYYFVKDKSPGDVKGQDIEGFGAEWYLLTPEGEKVHD